MFPQEADGNLGTEIAKLICRSVIVTRAVKVVATFFRDAEVSHGKILDFTGASRDKMGGKSAEAVCNYAWGHRFCFQTAAEWFDASSINKAQHYHLAYIMELTEAALLKLGLDKFPVSKLR